jgi:hypothetical protein
VAAPNSTGTRGRAAAIGRALDGNFPKGRWSQGESIDGKGQFQPTKVEPMGEEPVLGPARPDSGAQKEQMGSASAFKQFSPS